MGNHKVAGKGTSELKTAKWHQLVLVSAPHNTQTAKSIPNLTTQLCGDL